MLCIVNYIAQACYRIISYIIIMTMMLNPDVQATKVVDFGSLPSQHGCHRQIWCSQATNRSTSSSHDHSHRHHDRHDHQYRHHYHYQQRLLFWRAVHEKLIPRIDIGDIDSFLPRIVFTAGGRKEEGGNEYWIFECLVSALLWWKRALAVGRRKKDTEIKAVIYHTETTKNDYVSTESPI